VIHIAKNGQLIATYCNFQYVHWLDQFVRHLAIANIDNYVVVPVDNQTHDWLVENAPGHALIVPEILAFGDAMPTTGEAFTINMPLYNQLLQLKPMIVKHILGMGFSVLYADTDVMFYSDPFIHMRHDCDISVQVIRPDNLRRSCAGLFFAAAGKHKQNSLRLINKWIEELSMDLSSHDNPSFIKSILYLSEVGDPKICALDTSNFQDGCNAFGKYRSEKNKRIKPVLIHHSCVSGDALKIARAKYFNLWLDSNYSYPIIAHWKYDYRQDYNFMGQTQTRKRNLKTGTKRNRKIP